MERNISPIKNNCSMKGIKPAMMELPYPPIQVGERNQDYADLLSNDYCGAVSELSAIAQYINNENKMCCENCPFSQTILGIAMAEMMHLQKLGELINLLGGNISFAARQMNGKQIMWTPAFLAVPDRISQMIRADIDAEKAAISQYKVHMSRIRDEYVNAVLARIIKDEEYHIMLLQALQQ